MRGKALDKPFSKLRCRITPAYAGKSSAMSRIRSLYWDHPRLCGEKSTTDKLPRHCRGSPPPMRGKVWTRFELGKMAGITPAYAGKSLFQKPSGFLRQDHPRLCGEKFNGKAESCIRKGSPPPMRGKGNLWCRYQYNRRDHPRLCGEKIAEPLMYLIVTGSPPPMRGKVQQVWIYRQCRRITPAYAGKRTIA